MDCTPTLLYPLGGKGHTNIRKVSMRERQISRKGRTTLIPPWKGGGGRRRDAWC